MSRLALVPLLFATLVLAACGADPSPTPQPRCPDRAPTAAEAQSVLEGVGSAVVTVAGGVEGSFIMELYPDAAPVATANFVLLARCGYYDGIWFHRVLEGFVIQAGDPQTRDRTGDFAGVGTGGPGYAFEIEPVPADLDYVPYSLSMANNTISNGSQFFIAVSDLAGRLPKDYTIFGQVVSGTDVVDAIAAVPVNDPTIGVPLTTVGISAVTIGGPVGG